MKERELVEKKLAFYQIKGLAPKMQAAFEKVQTAVLKNMTPGKITLTITVSPPEDEDGRFGRINYSVGVKETPSQSKSFHTLFKNGCIINDGDSDAEAAQLDLDLPQAPRVLTLNKKEA